MLRQLAEYQRIRQRTLRWVDAESLSHAQGTPEHVKEMQQTGPSYANPASRADVVDATRSGFTLQYWHRLLK